ncbi:MAG: hypothetical protein Q9224_003190 [Gallowayella concinna]
MFFTKLSLLLLYYRIFAPDRMTKYLVILGILYCFVLYASYLLLTFLLCQSQIISYCKHQWNLFLLTTSGLNVLGDFYLLAIPLAAVAKLQMPFRKKLGVSAIFFTGLLVMEINTGIIVSCMPTMPALIQDIRSQLTRSPKISQKSRTNTINTSRYNSRSRSHQKQASLRDTILTSKKTSRSKSQQKKGSDQSNPQAPPVPPMAELPNRKSPVELTATPVQMEDARTEPRSHFSDYSSDLDHGGYWWLS